MYKNILDVPTEAKAAVLNISLLRQSKRNANIKETIKSINNRAGIILLTLRE
ncbi:hypothetical protein GCM10007094_32700 [Pseudovibrio japonicus]|uniref:Uncharacterized protein n=1 Tax=Pseudovibrio japonicus TaxID=366534 RepID=A0ABQ3EIB4_9HYPH|nr:hypothetical protein GCM10007094_32700 [Pseudovibrio japonicus]